jgi:hypothetical protein
MLTSHMFHFCCSHMFSVISPAFQLKEAVSIDLLSFRSHLGLSHDLKPIPSELELSVEEYIYVAPLMLCLSSLFRCLHIKLFWFLITIYLYLSHLRR